MTLTNTGTTSWNGSVAVYDQSGVQLASSTLLVLTPGSSQTIQLNPTIPRTYAVGSQYTWYVVVNGACSNCTQQAVPYNGTVNVAAILYVTPGGAVSFTASGVPSSVVAVVGQTASLAFTLVCNPQSGQTCPSGITVNVVDTANNSILASGSFTASQLASVPYATYSVSLSWIANVPNIPGNTSCFPSTLQPQCGGQTATYASCISISAYSSTTGALVWSTTLPYIICPTAVRGQITASLSMNTVYFIVGGYSTYQNVFLYLNNTSPNNLTVNCSITTSGGSTANICFGGAGIYNAPCQVTVNVPANSSAMSMFQIAYSQSAFPNPGQYQFTLQCSCGQNCTVSIANPNITVIVSALAFAVIGPNNCIFSPGVSGLIGTCSVTATAGQQFNVPVTVNIYNAPQNSTVSITANLLNQQGSVVASQSTTWCNYSGSGCNVINQPVTITLSATAPSTPGDYQFTLSIALSMGGQTVGNVQLPIYLTVKPQITFTYGFVAVPTNTVSGPNGTSQILALVIGCNCPQPTQFKVKLYNAQTNALVDMFISPQIGPNAPGNAQCPSQAGAFCSQYRYFAVVPISVKLPSLFELMIIRGIPQSTLVSNYSTYGYLWQDQYNVVVEPMV
jgi:hypothetical protein